MQKILSTYRIWHGCWINLDKLEKFSLGAKTENLFIEIIENLFIASRKPIKDKFTYLSIASDKLDLLKFLLQVIWEMKLVDDKKYITLSERLNEVGKMLGGWLKNNSAHRERS